MQRAPDNPGAACPPCYLNADTERRRSPARPVHSHLMKAGARTPKASGTAACGGFTVTSFPASDAPKAAISRIKDRSCQTPFSGNAFLSGASVSGASSLPIPMPFNRRSSGTTTPLQFLQKPVAFPRLPRRIWTAGQPGCPPALSALVWTCAAARTFLPKSMCRASTPSGWSCFGRKCGTPCTTCAIRWAASGVRMPRRGSCV